jgi:hypothetical protein
LLQLGSDRAMSVLEVLMWPRYADTRAAMLTQ